MFRTIGKILNQPAKRAKLRVEAEQSALQNDSSVKEQLEPQQHRSSGESSDSHCAIEAKATEDDFAPEEVIQVRMPPPLCRGRTACGEGSCRQMVSGGGAFGLTAFEGEVRREPHS